MNFDFGFDKGCVQSRARARSIAAVHTLALFPGTSLRKKLRIADNGLPCNSEGCKTCYENVTGGGG